MASSNRDYYTFSNHDSLDPGLRDTLTSLLRGWDDTNDIEEHAYLAHFSPDTTLVFGGIHKGREAIRAFRNSMIHPTNGPIVGCQHVFDKALVGTDGVNEKGEGEICGMADVIYTLTDGKKINCRAASWAKFVNRKDEQSGKADLQAERYEVFLDSHELTTEIGKLGSPAEAAGGTDAGNESRGVGVEAVRIEE